MPDEITSRVIDIDWGIGKTGELCPIIIIEPVELAGTIVKRVSGYNAGYILENKLGKGAIISIAKAGDIIPKCNILLVKVIHLFFLKYVQYATKNYILKIFILLV